MLDPDSRYADQPIDTLLDVQGNEIRYVRRRIVPDPNRFRTLAEVVVHASDRLDLISARSFGNPGIWWRIADANEAVDPAELVALPGRRLKIPSPV